MKVENYREYHGPNPFSNEPVVYASVNGLPETVPGQEAVFEKLFANLEGEEFRPAYKNLKDGALVIAQTLATYILKFLNNTRGFLHTAGAEREGETILIWTAYHNAAHTIKAIELAMDNFNGIVEQGSVSRSLKVKNEDFQKKCHMEHPDYQAKILMEEARANDIPYLPLMSARRRIWQFGWGKRATLFSESRPDEDSVIGHRIQKNKVGAKTFMQYMGLPVSQYRMINRESDLKQAVSQIGWPCVIKPVDRGRGRGVTVNIRNRKALHKAFREARALSQQPIMLEKYVEGAVYRLLVVRGSLIAASGRCPAQICGDGVRTVEQLVDELNSEIRESVSRGAFRGEVIFDAEVETTLTSQGLSRDSVPNKELRVRLREIPFQSSGATNVDVTDEVHPTTRQMVEMAAETLKAAVCGFDFISQDISKSALEQGAFLEMNGTPSLRGHLVNGQDVRGVAKAVLGDVPSRIPACLVVVEPEHIESLRFTHVFGSTSKIGWASRKSFGIGSARLKSGQKSLFQHTFSLLSNRVVTGLVVFAEPQEIYRSGLCLDKFDATCMIENILNQTWEHVIERCSESVEKFLSLEDVLKGLEEYLKSLEDHVS